ncbi:MAB_1171c family putative transporter [Streptomyces kanamyceticus]|uniref:DUF6545 domain-containing protein n=1 Tax=Streptomyces kanamyceticus TaxID=1967 RepID=A0A5J6GPN1_STRKN|nr:MAB_1171c family putative transporter [Streptomyces kanamyceticus]QEU96943.1 hypothetical protein CP970_43825 [Streptomyces kanamyceticus]
MFGVFFAVLAAATLWKLYQLSRAPKNLPLRWLTLSLLCAAVQYFASIADAAEFVDEVVVAGTAKIITNVMVMGMTYSLLVFYVVSVEDGPAGRRRARWEGVGLLGSIGVLMAAAISAPHHSVLDDTYAHANMRIPQVFLFYFCVGVYLTYALVMTCRWTYRYARQSSSSDAVGLWMATAGLLGMTACCAVRAVFVVIRFRGGEVPELLTFASALLMFLSTPLFVLGFTWPGLRARFVTWRAWRHHRRVHRQLEPLWQLLSTAFPNTVLLDAGWGYRTFDAHRRYARRVVECRDGLVRISAQLPIDRTAETTSEGLPARDIAIRIRHAAEAVRRGEESPLHGKPLLLPHARDRESDVQQLVALSQALRGVPGHPYCAEAGMGRVTGG